MSKTAAYDIVQWFVFQAALDALRACDLPKVAVVVPARIAAPAHVGVVCGSFNPLTTAHTQLGELAMREAGLDSVMYTLATITVDKETVTGLGLADRCVLISSYIERHPGAGLALVNRGLYVEQAGAMRSLWGAHPELYFIIGMDKLVQILDARYYDDRAAALRRLFALTSLIVANRGQMGRDAFSTLMDLPKNRPYRHRVRYLALPDTLGEVSATAVRAAAAAGRRLDHSAVPPETAHFLRDTRVFGAALWIAGQAVDAYALRQRLLRLLFAVRGLGGAQVEFAGLMRRALAADGQGRALRRATSGAEVLEAVRRYSNGSAG